MSEYNPKLELQLEDNQGFPRFRVNDTDALEILMQIVLQLKVISLKLDCLQAEDEVLSESDLESEEV